MVSMFWEEVGISWMAKSKPKLKICKAIYNAEAEGGLTKASGPDIDNFLQAAEEEGFL